jgi:hypothetical protein
VSAIFAAAGYTAPDAMILGAELAAAAAAVIGIEQDLLGTGQETVSGEALRRLRGRLLTLDLKTFPTLGRAADELGSAPEIERTLVGSMVLAGMRERMKTAATGSGRQTGKRANRG